VRAAVCALLVLLVACHEAKRNSATVDTAVALPYDTFNRPDSDSTHVAPVDSIMGTNTVPMLASPSVVLVSDSAGGDTLFHGKARCFTCHGSQADGMTTLGPNLTDTTWLHGNGSLAMIEQTVTHGVASPVVSQIAMPAYIEQLTPAEIRRVASYVYSLSHHGSVIPDTTVADTARADSVRTDSLHRVFLLPDNSRTTRSR
jgi:mono/diheme cytochrome c family protein